MTIPDVTVALHVLRAGTEGKLPVGVESNSAFLALIRGCELAEVAELRDAKDPRDPLALIAMIRFAASEIAATRGPRLNWPGIIAILAGWDEARAERALDVAQAAGLIGRHEEET